MSRRTAVVSILLTSLVLSVLLVADLVGRTFAGLAFAAALAVTGLLSRGFRGV